MSVNLSNFESNLLRLGIVWGRVMTIFKDYPNHMNPGMDELMIRHLYREVTVEQLHNFIRIRRDLIKNSDFKKLDDIIKELIQPILQYKKPIKELRNNYVAHIQEDGRNFKVLINDIIVKYNFPTNFAFYRYLTGLAFYYCGIVERNFPKEWNKAMKKYNAKLGFSMKINSGFKMYEVNKKIQPILSPMQIILYDNKFKTSVSRLIIEKLRKKYSKPKI